MKSIRRVLFSGLLVNDPPIIKRYVPVNKEKIEGIKPFLTHNGSDVSEEVH